MLTLFPTSHSCLSLFWEPGVIGAIRPHFQLQQRAEPQCSSTYWKSKPNTSGKPLQALLRNHVCGTDTLHFAPQINGHASELRFLKDLATTYVSDDLVSKDDPLKIFVNRKKIGEGYGSCVKTLTVQRTFGEVFCALDIRSLEKVAVKTMDLNDNYEEDLVMEIAMMRTLSHTNIVKYIDSYIVKDRLWVRKAAQQPLTL